MRRIAANALIELVGTFVLLLAVVLAESSAGRWAPLVSGAVLALLAALGSGRLGGHFNPAVSLAEALRGRGGHRGDLRARPHLLDLPVRWVAQAAGAVLGALLGHRIARHHPMAQALHGRTLLHTGMGELVITFTLVWVVLDVLRHRTPRTSWRQAPQRPGADEPATGSATPTDLRSAITGDTARSVVMAVGLVATVLLLTVGHMSGMALNPAVVLGRGIARLTVWRGLWPWVLLELLAGLVAGLGVRLLERRSTRTDADTADRDAADRELPGASATGADPVGTGRRD